MAQGQFFGILVLYEVRFLNAISWGGEEADGTRGHRDRNKRQEARALRYEI